MEVIGSRTSDNPAALDRQKNDDTGSKLPLNSVKNDTADPLLPALSRPGQKTSPRENLGIRAMSGRRVRCAIWGCDVRCGGTCARLMYVRCDLFFSILTVIQSRQSSDNRGLGWCGPLSYHLMNGSSCQISSMVFISTSLAHKKATNSTNHRCPQGLHSTSGFVSNHDHRGKGVQPFGV